MRKASPDLANWVLPHSSSPGVDQGLHAFLMIGYDQRVAFQRAQTRSEVHSLHADVGALEDLLTLVAILFSVIYVKISRFNTQHGHGGSRRAL